MATRSKQIVQLNNRGVAYLEKGGLHRSFTLFRDCLRRTMTQIGDPSTPALPAPVPEHAPGQAPLWKRRGVAAFATATALQRHLACAPSEFLFSQGITLMEEAGAYSPNPIIDTTVASSIVLFNLALVHHLKGLNESSSLCLSKAHSFYFKGYQLLAGTGMELGSSGNPVVDLLSMALLNNAAQVGRELCYKQISQETFKQLVRVANQVNAVDYGESSIAVFMEQVKCDFLLNAIVLGDQSLAQAA